MEKTQTGGLTCQVPALAVFATRYSRARLLTFRLPQKKKEKLTKRLFSFLFALASRLSDLIFAVGVFSPRFPFLGPPPSQVTALLSVGPTISFLFWRVFSLCAPVWVLRFACVVPFCAVGGCVRSRIWRVLENALFTALLP